MVWEYHIYTPPPKFQSVFSFIVLKIAGRFPAFILHTFFQPSKSLPSLIAFHYIKFATSMRPSKITVKPNFSFSHHKTAYIKFPKFGSSDIWSDEYIAL